MAAKQYTAAFKAWVALATLKGDKTVHELSHQSGVHPTLIHDWKKQLLAGAKQVFAGGARADTAADAQNAELFEQIGQGHAAPDWRPIVADLCMELAWGTDPASDTVQLLVLRCAQALHRHSRTEISGKGPCAAGPD